MAPTVTDGDRWLVLLRTPIGRDRKTTAVVFTWPDQMERTTCPLRTTDSLRETVTAECTA